MRYYEFIILLAQRGDASNFYFKVSHHHLGNVNCGGDIIEQAVVSRGS